MKVCVLWHVHSVGATDEKLIGIYADADAAEQALARLIVQPGFRDCPEGFSVDSYEVGKDHWTEGYATV